MQKTKILVRFDKHLFNGIKVFGASLILEVFNPDDITEVVSALKLTDNDPTSSYDSIGVVRPESPENAAARAFTLQTQRLQFLHHKAALKANHESPGPDHASTRSARIAQLLASWPWCQAQLNHFPHHSLTLH